MHDHPQQVGSAADPHSRSLLDGRRPEFYTAAETSQILRLDESTLYRHLRHGTFPGVKIGGRYVVPRAVLERLIADVIATGRCVDLRVWTESWRAEQEAAAQRFAGGPGDVAAWVPGGVA